MLLQHGVSVAKLKWMSVPLTAASDTPAILSHRNSRSLMLPTTCASSRLLRIFRKARVQEDGNAFEMWPDNTVEDVSQDVILARHT